MPKKQSPSAADYIQPLYINGLNGRMLHLPASTNKTREILFIYGHHSSLERWWGIMQDLSQYGNVTMPDLPGFGGMDSFFKIDRRPTIDNLADYLATFVKLRYKRKRVTILGLSFGFVVATRMLQRYPDLTKKVDLLVSVVGFARYDEFSFSKPRYWTYLLGAKLFSYHLPAIFFKNIVLNPGVLHLAYSRTHNAQEKFAGLKKEDRRLIMNFEVYLWHANDVRTYMITTTEFLRLDNCQQRVDLPLWHIYVKNDRYFDYKVVEQHLKIIYSKVHTVQSKADNHAPSIIADKKAAASLIPRKLRQILSEQ